MNEKNTAIVTKSENKQAVYRYIMRNPRSTRQDLFIGLGLSLPTIKQSISFLESENLITASGVVHNTGGRNATAYSITGKGRQAIGIYLSSGHITAVTVDLTGLVTAMRRIRIEFDIHSDDYLKTIGDLALQVKKESGLSDEDLIGCGIAIQSFVSDDGEEILFGMAHDFSGATRATISKYLPQRTRLIHDSFAAGYAETWNSTNIRNAVYINLNYSVGGSIIINNEVFQGDNHRAGEIGHIIINPKSRNKCYCGRYGCFDTCCNAGILDRAAGGLDNFFVLLDGGDEKAADIWENYLDNLALCIHNLRMIYDCPIILGGYVGAYIDKYMDQLCRKVDDLSIFGSAAHSYLYPCRYRTEATAAGAAMHMIDLFIREL